MIDHSDDFLYSGDGDEAEILIYAPDPEEAALAFERTLPAAALPGAASPVCACASGDGSGRAVLSSSYAVPALASVPRRGVLLSTGLPAGIFARNLGVASEEVGREVVRRLFETRGSVPRSSTSLVRRMCEGGALAAAGDGLIEEEDLAFFASTPGEQDAIGRRDLARGERDWTDDALYRGVNVLEVGAVLDSEGVESLDLRSGDAVLLVAAGAGELGRLAFASHEQRLAGRVRYGLFDPAGDFDAAPLDTDEATDFLTASATVANFADARAALLVYALRRALAGTVEDHAIRASWRVGGVSLERDGALHLTELARVGEGEPLVCGGASGRGTSGGGICAGVPEGMMYGVVPEFGVREEDGRWPWEEAGLLERWARLGPFGG